MNVGGAILFLGLFGTGFVLAAPVAWAIGDDHAAVGCLVSSGILTLLVGTLKQVRKP